MVLTRRQPNCYQTQLNGAGKGCLRKKRACHWRSTASDILFEIPLLSSRDDNVDDTDTNDPLPPSDRARKAGGTCEAILSGWEFLQIWPSRLWLPFPPAAATYFVPGISHITAGWWQMQRKGHETQQKWDGNSCSLAGSLGLIAGRWRSL